MDKDYFLYFIALVAPEEIQSSITEIKLDFKNRFSASHALKSPPHITLIPPFRFDKKNENNLIKILDEFSMYEPRFKQKLDDFGSYPPRVIYIKVDKSDSLKNLHSRLHDQMYDKLSLSAFTRGSKFFLPHWC